MMAVRTCPGVERNCVSGSHCWSRIGHVECLIALMVDTETACVSRLADSDSKGRGKKSRHEKFHGSSEGRHKKIMSGRIWWVQIWRSHTNRLDGVTGPSACDALGMVVADLQEPPVAADGLAEVIDRFMDAVLTEPSG